MKGIREIIRESVREYLSRYILIPYDNDGYNEELEEYEIDEYEAVDIALKIAKNGGVNILRNKKLKDLLIDSKDKKIIGALWVSDSKDKFSFDIAIDTSYQNMGLSHLLIKSAIDEYKIQKDMYEDMGEDFNMEVDVINPKLAEILKNKYNFHVVADLSDTRVLMSLN